MAYLVFFLASTSYLCIVLGLFMVILTADEPE